MTHGSVRSPRMLALMLAAASLAAGWFGWATLSASHEAALAAAGNLAACRKLAADITRLESSPTRASTQPRSQTEQSRRIEAACATARMPAGSLQRIEPMPARRFNDTAYREHAIRVELQAVTMEQLTTFLHGLSSGDAPWDVADLHLAIPASQGAANPADAERWEVDLTLTYLVYSPKTPTGTSR